MKLLRNALLLFYMSNSKDKIIAILYNLYYTIIDNAINKRIEFRGIMHGYTRNKNNGNRYLSITR